MAADRTAPARDSQQAIAAALQRYRVMATVVGVLLALRDGGRLAPSAALAWGLAWVAVGRLTGELLSTPLSLSPATGTNYDDEEQTG